MTRNTEARLVVVTVAITMVAMATTAASAYGRNVATGGGPAWVAWKRTRRLAAQPFDPTAINGAMLYGDNYRGEEDHLLFPNDDDDGAVYPRRSQSPDPRRRIGPSGGHPLGLKSTPQSKSYADSAPLLVRPIRRKRRRQEGKTPGYVAPFARSLRRWDSEENLVDQGGRPTTTFGSRKIVRTPRERGRRRPLDDLLKSLHSPGNDFEAPKRQPPPGFHAIRGKRNSESDNETYSVADSETETETEKEPELENETENGEEISDRRLAAAVGDSFNASSF